MQSIEFWKALQSSMDVPFAIKEVKEVKSNCGTTWIELKDGTSFYLSIEKCKSEETENEAIDTN